MKYELPDAVQVEADGPLRIVRLCRPDQLNAVNDDLHLGLTRVFPQLSADPGALFEPGPQLSFAAAATLGLRAHGLGAGLRGLASVTAIAGAVTAPIAASHWGTAEPLALLVNLLADTTYYFSVQGENDAWGEYDVVMTGRNQTLAGAIETPADNYRGSASGPFDSAHKPD